MQILKANKGKSVTVHHILNSTNSICFVYDTGWTPSFECYMIDSNETLIEELKQGIIEQIAELSKDSYDKLYDYFVIYTNKEESELQDLIEWLDKNKIRLETVEILVACR